MGLPNCLLHTLAFEGGLRECVYSMLQQFVPITDHDLLGQSPRIFSFAARRLERSVLAVSLPQAAAGADCRGPPNYGSMQAGVASLGQGSVCWL